MEFSFENIVGTLCKALVKWFLVWGTSTEMLKDGLMVLKVCIVGIEVAKEMLMGRRLLDFSVASAWFEK